MTPKKLLKRGVMKYMRDTVLLVGGCSRENLIRVI